MAVVLAEDDLDLQLLLQIVLEQLDQSVTAVGTGTEALAACRNADIDLVLLDVSMPEMSGLEVCRAIRADAELHDLPVVLLTARSQPEDVSAGYAAGADSYVTKPFSPHELRDRLAGLLERRAVLT